MVKELYIVYINVQIVLEGATTRHDVYAEDLAAVLYAMEQVLEGQTVLLVEVPVQKSMQNVHIAKVHY